MFNRGSEWNKWDLHVHTPASVLHNEYNANWDLYVKDLFQKAIENNVSGIGITDYYFPDGYKKIKNEYLSDSEKMISILGEELYEKSKEIYLFPNIEFRIDKLILGKERDLKWNRKVNYHLLLSDEINIDIIETEIIQQLHFDYCSEPGGKPEKRIFTKDNLIELGNKLILEQASFNQKDPLLVGMLNSCISLDELANVIGNNKKFENKYLFGLPVDEDLSDVSWNSQGHSTRKI
ncbi:hypothetical protein B4900_03280 [Yersinia rohdei]|nr:hypothetical protein B4900_03280 [Yersinia rohdei]